MVETIAKLDDLTSFVAKFDESGKCLWYSLFDEIFEYFFTPPRNSNCLRAKFFEEQEHKLKARLGYLPCVYGKDSPVMTWD